MSEKSDYLSNEILDHILGEGARDFTSPATLFVALTTATISSSDTGATITEVANSNNYSRQALNVNAASGKQATNNGALVFTASGGNWGTVTSVCIVDSGTHGAGNILYFDNDITDTAVNDGQSITFADATGLVVSEA